PQVEDDGVDNRSKSEECEQDNRESRCGRHCCESRLIFHRRLLQFIPEYGFVPDNRLSKNRLITNDGCTCEDGVTPDDGLVPHDGFIPHNRVAPNTILAKQGAVVAQKTA